MNRITRRKMLVMMSMVASAAYRVSGQQAIPINVYRDRTCGCCGNWVAHLNANGFTANVTDDVQDMAAVRTKFRVPGELRSCHVAVVRGYVIEGHVPAADVRRLLKERPRVVGLSVPGMPIGSPGMEGVGGHPYDVLTFDARGKTRVYSTQQPKSKS